MYLSLTTLDGTTTPLQARRCSTNSSTARLNLSPPPRGDSCDILYHPPEVLCRVLGRFGCSRCDNLEKCNPGTSTPRSQSHAASSSKVLTWKVTRTAKALFVPAVPICTSQNFTSNVFHISEISCLEATKNVLEKRRQ